MDQIFDQDVKILKFQLTSKPQNVYFVTGYFFLAIVFLLSFFKPKDSHFQVHDFLDHFFVIEALRGEIFQFFDLNATIPYILGGVSLNTFNLNDLSLDHLIYQVFEPFVAVAIVEVTARTLAYVAFYYLAKEIFKNQPHSNQIAVIGALVYALLPYWPSVALTVACVPVGAILILKVLGNQSKKQTAVIAIFLSQNMNFTYGGFVFLLLLFITCLTFGLKKREKIWWVFYMLTAGFILANIRLIKVLLFDEFQPHRSKWPIPRHGWFHTAHLDGLQETLKEYFKNGQYHFGSGQVGINSWISVQMLLIVTSTILLIAVALIKNPKSTNFQRVQKMHFIGIVVWILVGTLYATETSNFTQFYGLFGVNFQFNRIIVLTPIIVTFLACTSVLIFIEMKTITRQSFIVAVIGLCLVLQTCVLYFPLNNKMRILGGLNASPSLIQYFNTDEYKRIKNQISESSTEYSVLSYGLDPMVASFNHFRSTDGYSYNYDYRYKVKFYEIIRHEIHGSSIDAYYRDWGSRVYLFESGLQRENPKFNWCAAYKLNTRYVLSNLQLDQNQHLEPIASTNKTHIYRITKCS